MSKKEGRPGIPTKKKKHLYDIIDEEPVTWLQYEKIMEQNRLITMKKSVAETKNDTAQHDEEHAPRTSGPKQIDLKEIMEEQRLIRMKNMELMEEQRLIRLKKSVAERKNDTAQRLEAHAPCTSGPKQIGLKDKKEKLLRTPYKINIVNIPDSTTFGGKQVEVKDKKGNLFKKKPPFKV